MLTLRNALLSSTAAILVVAPSMANAQSSGIDLLTLTVSNAQLIAGANVNAAKASPFGQFMLMKIQPGDMGLQQFINETGFNPFNDVSEIVVSSDSAPGPSAHWMVAARGIFGPAMSRVEAKAAEDNLSVTHLAGVDVIEVNSGAPGATTSGAPQLCVGFYTDGATAIVGECGAVTAAAQGQKPAGTLAAAAQTSRSTQDLWFTSVLPLPQIGSAAPSGLAPVLNNPLLQKIQQTSGGVKFAAGGAPGVQVTGQAVMDNPQDAMSLVNVAKFFLSFASSQTGSLPAGSTVSSLLSSVQITPAGNAVNVTLTIPETTLEQMFNAVEQGSAREQTAHLHRSQMQ